MNKKAIMLGLALLTGAFGYSADAATGVVNISTVLKADSQFSTALQTMGTEQKKAEVAFEKESKGKTQKDIQALAVKYRNELNAKNDQLMAPIQKRIFAAIEKIAKQKKLDTVVVPDGLIYGQPTTDITNDVVAEIK